VSVYLLLGHTVTVS